MDRQHWFAVSVLAVLLLILGAGIWHSKASAAKERQRDWQQKVLELKASEEAAHATVQSRREYVLEVLGMGVTVEKYRQGKLWEILQKGNAYTSIRETDPAQYPLYASDKLGQSGGRALDALQNGVESSPMFWGVPSLSAGPPILNPAKQPSDINPSAGLAGSAENTGMAWHLFVTGPWRRAERPDELLDEVFAFFDAHPTVPYVVVSALDGPESRYHVMAPDSPSPVRDGRYIPDMPDATAVFVLARRERVEPLRPFVWDDPDSDYLQENLRWMYFELMEAVPNPHKLANPNDVNLGRQPTIEEWLQATKEFAKHPFVKHVDDGKSPWLRPSWKNNPPKDWQPIPWFPVPWNREQMRAFDALPSLGFLHRPVFIKFKDEHGKPVTTRDARHKILNAGWQQALQTLPEPERAAAPSRIIAAFNDQTEQRIALEEMLRHYVAQGGPAIDSDNITQFINTDRRLGNTGAATFFVQIALGIMGSSKEGGVSAAINLRDPAVASIVLISPPKKDPAKPQDSEDNFKHKNTPLIDPENYNPPSVDDVLGTRKSDAVDG